MVNLTSKTRSPTTGSRFSTIWQRFTHFACVLRNSYIFELFLMSILILFSLNSHAVESRFISSESEPCVGDPILNVEGLEYKSEVPRRRFGDIIEQYGLSNHQWKSTGNISTSFSQFRSHVGTGPDDIITEKLRQKSGKMTWENLNALADVDRKRLSRRHLTQSSGDPSGIGFRLGGNADPQTAG